MYFRRNLIKFIIISSFSFLYFSCSSSISSEKQKKTKAKPIDSTHIKKVEEKTKALKLYVDELNRVIGFNGGILVAYKGEIIYNEVLGYANKKKKELLKKNYRFQLASVSKQFTAAAVMLLHQDSLLNLHDKVTKFFPKFPYPKITVRMLLTHRSGLSNYMYFAETLTNRKNTIYNSDVMNLMIKHKPRPYLNPDIKYDYCNTNYAILASIVEKVSGEKYHTFVEKRIFKPAGMKDSFHFIKDKNEPEERIATGYHYRWTEAYHTYQEGVLGDKGVYSTLGDMFKWDRALYTEKILTKQSLKQMFTGGNPEKEDSDYGFGWRLPKRKAYTNLVYHSGWYRGFNTVFARDTTEQHTIIILSNVRTKVFMDVYREIYEMLKGNALEMLNIPDQTAEKKTKA